MLRRPVELAELIGTLLSSLTARTISNSSDLPTSLERYLNGEAHGHRFAVSVFSRLKTPRPHALKGGPIEDLIQRLRNAHLIGVSF